MNKKILLIGNTESPSFLRLQEEAQKMGVLLDAITPEQIVLAEGRVSFLGVDGLGLQASPEAYDIFYFRGVGRSAPSLQTIAKILRDTYSKKIVEPCFAEGGFPEDKIVPISKQGLYEVPSSRVVCLSDVQNESFEASFPLVVKKLGFGSSKGKWVQKIASKEALFAYIGLAPEDTFLLQSYVPLDFDTRVLVVGGRVLGGFDRYRKEGEDFLTTVRGGKREVSDLSDAQCAAAIEAANLQGLEIAGVDLALVGDTCYVIEVNASPQFRVFERKTGVNVASAILEHILK